MAGQIIKRGDRKFLVRVFIGRGTSTRKYRGELVTGLVAKFNSKIVHGTRKDAARVLRQMHAERDAGLEPSRDTLDVYLTTWLKDSSKPRHRASTHQQYEKLLAHHIRPRLGMVQLSKLTALQIEGVYGAMTAKGLSPRTVRYTHAVLHSALEKAVRMRLISSNPASGAELPRKITAERRAFTEEQRSALLSRAAGTREYPMLLLAASIGLRPSEYLGLKWSDVDLEAATLNVQRMLSRRGKAWSFEEPKTKNSRRRIDLPSLIVDALREHKKAQAIERLALGKVWRDLGLIFPATDGGPERERTIVSRFKRLLSGKCPSCDARGKFAGKRCVPCGGTGARPPLPDLRLYALRHTAATLALQAGVPVQVVSRMLGHATVAFTLDTYIAILPGQQADAASKIDAALRGQ